jgi:hypothetical protein
MRLESTHLSTRMNIALERKSAVAEGAFCCGAEEPRY